MRDSLTTRGKDKVTNEPGRVSVVAYYISNPYRNRYL